MASVAWPTDVPVVRAKWWAAERSPLPFHPPPPAARAAARPFTVAAIFSMDEAKATALAACSVDRTDASNVDA